MKLTIITLNILRKTDSLSADNLELSSLFSVENNNYLTKLIFIQILFFRKTIKLLLHFYQKDQDSIEFKKLVNREMTRVSTKIKLTVKKYQTQKFLKK